MIFYLFIFTLLFVLYRVRFYLRMGYTLYQTFRKMVDPDGSKGHYFALKSAIGFMKERMGYQSLPPVEKFNRDYIKISYMYKSKPFFYLLKVKRGVTPLLSIVDENQNDVMDAVMPYLGPNLDCHNIVLTPKDFGYERIVVTTVLDSTITFEENDTISF